MSQNKYKVVPPNCKLFLKYIVDERLTKSPEPEELINTIIKGVSSFFSGLNSRLDQWRRGDLEGLSDRVKKQSEGESIADIQRNYNMAVRFIDLSNDPNHKNKRLFSCVGLVHTAGKMSVQEFLHGFGYTTERVLV